jgi:signal transduction histidine kinase
VHDVIEAGEYLRYFEVLYFLPIALFFIPVVYAAWYFGSVGSISTAILTVIITIPNWVFWHHGLERLGVIFQLFILLVAAAIIGNRVDRETEARHQIEDSHKALRIYADHVVQAQEEERQRIAHELHDQTIQMLTLLTQRLDGIKDRNMPLPSEVSEELMKVREMSEQVSKELREFIRNIHPPILDDLGVIPAIRRLLLESTERMGINSDFRPMGEEKRLSPRIEVGIFRITQAALWNIERHAQATEVSMAISLTRDEAKLDISDNGIGFEVPPIVSSLYASGKFGILGMHERAESIGGKLEVQSIPHKGTTISLSVPIQRTTPRHIS